MYLAQASALLATLLLAPLSAVDAAASLDCKNIRIKGHSFNLDKLSGPHSVVTSRWDSGTQAHFNTTYTVDFCKPLKKSGDSKKGEECPNGTRVCAIERELKEDVDIVSKVVAIAGNLENVGGSAFDYEATRLKASDSHSDSQKEGLRLVLKGGKNPLTGKTKREQRAVIEFLCDQKKTGLENEWDTEERYDGDNKKSKREDKEKDKDKEEGDKDGDKKGDEDKDGKGDDGDDEDDGEESGVEHQLIKDGAALIWESYGPNDADDADVLRLTWHTEAACEKRDDNDGDDGEDSEKKASWGFFTWFFIIVFLGIASYLIFGSWLNYTRYGARGWDLLPHGDAIRDIPYLMKDWTRSVLNTVQGTGSRGGYSAV